MTYTKDSPPDRIVKAARALFFANGFARVSTDTLAKEASVSKATLYKYFPNMVEVLKAVCDVEAESFEAGTPTDVESLQELRLVLVRYGAKLMMFLNQPEILQFKQLMHEEARAHPDIAAEFYHSAYGRTLRVLSELLRQGVEKGFLHTDLTPEELAEQLVGMWEGVPYVKAQLGVTEEPFPAPAAWSEKCVSTLLD